MSAKYKKPDLFMVHNSNPKIEKFVNFIMKSGKKNIAKRIFDETMEAIKIAGHANPILVWETAIENSSPNVMVKSRRIGGAVYAIPLEVKWERKFFYASKWILDASRSKKWSIVKKLTKELLEAYTNQWYAVKKKEDAHRNAEANKANAHLARYVK